MIDGLIKLAPIIMPVIAVIVVEAQARRASRERASIQSAFMEIIKHLLNERKKDGE